MRETRLDGAVASLEGVIISIRNARRLVLKVANVVRRDLIGEAREFGGGLHFGKVGDEFGGRRQDLPAVSRKGSRIAIPLNMHQRPGGGAGGVGDLGAREHAGDFFLARGRVKHIDAGAHPLALTDPVHPPMGVGAGGDLGAVGDDHHLGAGGQAPQPLTNGVGHRAANTLINLIEDHQRLIV